MNPRIRELELEAIAYADSKVPARDRYNDIYHSIVRGKFAELIVQECIQSIKGSSMDSGDEWEQGLRMAESSIREKFGIK